MQNNYRSKYISDIEILRAFAILLVIFEHFKHFFWNLNVPYSKEIYAYLGGGRGVDLFFVVSGFVIARSILFKLQEASTTQLFFRQSITFWIRRFWRLAPSSWLWLIIPTVLCVIFNQSGIFGTLKGNFAGLVAGLLNVYNFYFAEVFGNDLYRNASFVQWTLSLEAQFYFALPFIVFFARKRLSIVLIVLIIIQLIFLSKYWTVVFRTDGFFIGVLIALWQQRKSTYLDFEPTFLNHPLARIIFITLILLGLATMSSKLHIVPNYYRNSMAAIVSAIAVLAASYNQDYFIRAAWLKKVLLWIGARSYGIYLIHIIAFDLVWETCFRFMPDFREQEHWLLSALIFAIPGLMLTFIISELNFRLIEEPFRKKGRGIAKEYFDSRNKE